MGDRCGWYPCVRLTRLGSKDSDENTLTTAVTYPRNATRMRQIEILESETAKWLAVLISKTSVFNLGEDGCPEKGSLARMT